MIKTVVINGSGGSGKDSFVSYAALDQRFDFANVSTIAPVKEGAKLLGWNPVCKTPKDRKFLSDLKDLCTRYCDLSMCHIRMEMENFRSRVERSGRPGVMFIHCREPDEIARLVDEFGATTLLVIRPNMPDSFGNHADDGVRGYVYDYVVSNAGTLEDLAYSAKTFIKDLMEQ